MPGTAISWKDGRRSSHYYPKKVRVNVEQSEVRELVAAGDVVFVSYTQPGETDWTLGRFCFRQPRKATNPIDRPGCTHYPELDDIWPVLEAKGLGIYRVSGHDPDALHIGNNAYWAGQRNLGRNRESMPRAPGEAR